MCLRSHVLVVIEFMQAANADSKIGCVVTILTCTPPNRDQSQEKTVHELGRVIKRLVWCFNQSAIYINCHPERP
jgi:hypothetical protein